MPDILMRSRRSVTSACSPVSSFSTLSRSTVPGEPLSIELTSDTSRPRMLRPSTSSSLSPMTSPALVGGKSLVGLRDRDPVAALAHEGADSSVFAGGEYLELLHLVLGYQDGVRVEIRGHSGGRVPKHFVRVDRIDVKRAHVAEHVEQNLYVAPEREIGLRCGRERSRPRPAVAAAISA